MLCIECSHWGIQSLYTLHKNFIRLSICPKCSRVADKYIEFDETMLSIDIVLLKGPAYRHLAYNVTEAEMRKDNTGSFLERYKMILRLVVMVMLFEVYLTWAYEEKQRLHSLVISYILQQKIIPQYLFFLLKLVIEQALFNLSIQVMLRRYLRWGVAEDSTSYGFGYNTCVLLTAVLVSSSVKLFPILMLIWPYDGVTILSWLINLAAVLSTIEALKLVVRRLYISITAIVLLSVIAQQLLSKVLLCGVVSAFLGHGWNYLLWNEWLHFHYQWRIVEQGIWSLRID